MNHEHQTLLFLLSLYFVINNKQQNSLHDPRYSSFKDSSAVDVKSSELRFFMIDCKKITQIHKPRRRTTPTIQNYLKKSKKLRKVSVKVN